ncbi:hypothetical protein TNCT_104054 [Trichonephila clavata]|uniref:Uncharacterized protein n=1 Tax=Trichonephila clavata TaxID=2740835 RepID=A0A8X6HBL7_TRICU|nr:hypothetical protein TNCT_104054 [Trichonephila clavata]
MWQICADVIAVVQRICADFLWFVIMGIKASKKADITAPPQKDKKLKRKKSKKEAAAAVINGDTGIEEVSIQVRGFDFELKLLKGLEMCA